MLPVNYSAILARGLKIKSALILLFSLSFSVTYAQLPCGQSIHVSVTGIDEVGCGSYNTPCASINYGIGQAQDEGLHDVRISKGIYHEIIVVKNGIHLWGGYDESEGWTYGGGSIDITVIDGGQYLPDNQWLSVKADSIESRTVLSDLTIKGPDASGNGLSSYVVHITDSDSVYIQNCKIVNGKGYYGINGANGTNATSTAAPGGGDGADAQSFTSSCNTDHLLGGTGGTNAPAFAGGDGGSGGSMDTECNGGTCVIVGDCSATSGLKGIDGEGPSGGLGRAGGSPCNPGLHGNPGNTTKGTGGFKSADNGSIAGDYWLTTTAGNGMLGAHGSGGGGGGGSGGCDIGIDDQGAGGGGGGSGGVRAPSAGSGGRHGGNSYGIFAIRSSLNLKSVSFSGGTGGNGGNGGNGGFGQPGGPGGMGGSGTADTGPGGDGGKGGDGGNSGGGAGGNGGSVIYVFSSSSNVTRDATIMGSGSPGIRGLGGTRSGTLSGQNGTNGSNIPFSGSNINMGPLPFFEPPCVSLSCLVFNNSDNGAGSFRDRIACVTPGDTLFFDSNMMNDTIVLDSAIIISKDITIYVAPGQNIWLKGIGLDNTLKIMAGATVEIIGLKVWGSNGPNGVLWNLGDLTLRHVLIFGDNSPGAIFSNEGILELKSRSSIFRTPH